MSRYLFPILIAVFALAGCGGNDREYRILQAHIQQTQDKIESLRTHLEANRLSNAIRLNHYSRIIAANNPSLKELADTLALEGTPNGLLFASLNERLDELKLTVSASDVDIQTIRTASATARSLYSASLDDEFNRALADPVNVLADLSQGQLPRSDAISAQSETGVGLEPGTQLVGNPTYGQWQSNASGGSFWVWYGQYALLRNVLGGRQYGYSDWSRDRRYSYYHDYGRGNYTSPKQASNQRNTENRAKQKFAREGKSFTSPYARTRNGASLRVSRVKTQQRAAPASTRTHSQLSSRSTARGK